MGVGKAHTSIQVQPKQSGIPCAMGRRLMPWSPRSRIPLASVTAGLMVHRSGWIGYATGSLAPATGVRTTRFCRTQSAPSSCAPSAAHELTSPCNHLARRRPCVHRISPRVRDDRDTPLLPGRDARKVPVIWDERETLYFCADDWTTQIRLNPFSKLDYSRGCPSSVV